MGEAKRADLRVRFDGRIRLQFHGAKVTSDAGLLAVRELDDALGLTELAGLTLAGTRTGRNVQHDQVAHSEVTRLSGPLGLAVDPPRLSTVCRCPMKCLSASALPPGGGTSMRYG